MTDLEKYKKCHSYQECFGIQNELKNFFKIIGIHVHSIHVYLDMTNLSHDLFVDQFYIGKAPSTGHTMIIKRLFSNFHKHKSTNTSISKIYNIEHILIIKS